MITLGELYRGCYLYGMVSVTESGAKGGKCKTLYSGYNLVGIPAELLKRAVRFMIPEGDTLIIEVYHC